MKTKIFLNLGFLCFLLFGIHSSLQGQTDSNSIEIVYDTLSVADTASVYSYRIDEYGDTFFESKENYIQDFYSEQYRYQRTALVNTGNLGSPAQQLIFDIDTRIDQFRLFNPYRYYEIKKENFRFLRSPVDYSIVKYNQALAAQADLNVRAKAIKNWSENLSMTVDFERMSQAEGQFTFQATRNTLLGIGFDYISPSNNYRLLLIYTRNKIQQQFNWGLNIPNTNKIEQDDNTLNFDVISTSAEGLFETTQIALNQEYQLFKPDSNRIFNGLLYYNLEYQNHINRYSDNNPGSEYKNLLVDQRAIRLWFQNRHIINQAGLGFRLWNSHDFRMGVSHRYFWIDNDLDRFNEQEMRIHGNAKGPVGQRGKYKATLELPFYSNAGRVLVGGELNTKFYQDKVDLKLKYQFVKSAPHYTVENLIISQRALPQGRISDPIHQKIGGEASYLNRLTVEAYYHNFQDPYYYDSNYSLVQNTGNHSAITASMKANVKFWKLNIQPVLRWQELPSFYYLPAWAMDVDLSFSEKLFNDNLDLFLGTTVRMFDTYRPYHFVPVLNTFALQERYLSPEYPILDFYAAIHVSGFRFFVRSENLLPQFNNQLPLSELVYRSPQFSGYLRLGIVWSFFN